MIRSTEKLKARFEKYDKISMVICGILILINLLSIFHLRDYIFIGSFFSVLLFLVVKNIDDNKKYPIDNVDQFYFEAHSYFRKYQNYIVLMAACIHLLLNLLFHFCDYLTPFNNSHYLIDNIIFLWNVEFLFLGLSAYVSKLLFNFIRPYDFRSNSIFYSKKRYLLNAWNFLFYRKKVYGFLEGEQSYFKIWRENRNIIVADKISELKKELQSLDDDFLKKMHLYLLYPYDFGGNSAIQMDYLIEKVPKVVGFISPIVLGYLFNGFQTLQDILFIIQLSIFVWLIWFVLVYLWNWISRKNLLDQIKVFLPLLINEELENRKSKRKYKRPHRYK